MQTLITRDSTSVPWGFRLKGGAEYNVPLSILKVNEGSPSWNRLEVGDVICSIGNYPALNLKHEEALNIIRMFDCSLPLTIQRQQSIFNPGKIAAKTPSTPVVWRPQSVSTYETPTSPRLQSNFAYNPSQPQVYQPQPQIYQSNYQPPQPQVYSPAQVYQPQAQVYSPAQVYQPQFFPSSPPAAPALSVSPIPPPPPLPDLTAPLQNFKLQKQADASQKKSAEPMSPNQVVPDALLNKVLNKSPMGQKPFSYTPGGLDLSHIRESARVKRYEQMSSKQETTRSLRQGSVGPDFTYQQPRYNTPQFNQNFTQSYNPPQPTQFQTYNNSPVQQLVQPTPPPPPPPAPSMYQSPQSMLNRSNSVSNESFTPMSPRQIRTPQKMQSPTSFSITPDQLMKAKKDNGEKRDMMNQSFSFKMLNKWIADSEAGSPIQLVSKKDEEENNVPKTPLLKKSEVIKALEEDELKPNRIRQSQSPQSVKFTPSYTVPSKVFQYVDRKFSESSESNFGTTLTTSHHQQEMQQQQNYTKPPAREREQEPPVSKYKGNHIPSKTFKYLQYITQNETDNSQTKTQSNESQIQQAQVQIATTNNSNQQIQQSNQVSYEGSFVKQQAKQHSFLNQHESAKQNSNSVSFPAYSTSPSEPKIITQQSTTSTFSTENVFIEQSAPLEQQQQQSSVIPDLILNSSIDEIVETVAHTVQVSDNENNLNNSENDTVVGEEEEEIPVLNEEALSAEPVLNEALNEPLVEEIPDSLSLINNVEINTDINLNQISSEQSQSNVRELVVEHNEKLEEEEESVKQPEITEQDATSQEVIETSEF
ncbi:unnamed protein product [Brachionus calyciflorus]|uniref:PDZ domain-containing protein n=1 Tax=Brachionus calyciflorus TaxID=104777 RepID=A0A813UVR4_9BILA|nr:unnamed protein product [Brachionus calyciflorus]